MLTWAGAMLFAFPSLRYALPGIPAVGTAFDFLVFLWAEGLVGVSLIAIAVTWARRSRRAPG